jgi:hypothetical protein
MIVQRTGMCRRGNDPLATIESAMGSDNPLAYAALRVLTPVANYADMLCRSNHPALAASRYDAAARAAA